MLVLGTVTAIVTVRVLEEAAIAIQSNNLEYSLMIEWV
jgi:hypothetical protein